MRNDAEVRAGRELDERIAREVLHLPDSLISLKGSKAVFTPNGRHFREVAELDHFSESIEAAWQVVEHLRQQGWLVRVQEMPEGESYWFNSEDPRARVFKRASCNLCWIRHNTDEDSRKRLCHNPWALGDSAPEAICLASLQAMEER